MGRVRGSLRAGTAESRLPSPTHAGAKIIPFPLSAGRRRRNKMGARYVECLLSGYWFQLREQSMVFNGVEYVIVDVMTSQGWNADGTPTKPRKQCELVVPRDELLRALATVRPREQDG